MCLITGATGNVGGKLVELLPEQGHGVRAMTRNPAKARFPKRVDVPGPGTFRAWSERNAAAFA